MVPLTPLTVIGIGALLSGCYLLVAMLAFALGGRPREAARDLSSLSALPVLTGLLAAGALWLDRPVGVLVALGLGALAVLLPPALAVASTFDGHAVDTR